MLGLSTGYKLYSLGRTEILKKLGNPFFSGIPKDGDEWNSERILGVAWVIFTRDFAEIDNLMSGADPLKDVDLIWRNEMHANEGDRIFDWIMQESGRAKAAQTEAIKETGGKPEAVGAETSPAG